METLRLFNGMCCLLQPMPSTHSVTMGLYIKAGVGYSEPMHGITHLLEHLHFRQLGDMNQDALYYQMESIGSSLRATTYRDFLNFSMKIVPCYFDKAIQIFVNLINATQWQKDCLEKEKQVVCNQISEEGTYLTIEDEARKCVFCNHPLARPIMGTAKSVKEITPEDVAEYKKKIFTADNVYFCVTGNFTAENKADMLEKLSFCNLSAPCSFLLEYPPVFHHRKPDIVFQCTNDNSPLDVDISFDLCTEHNDPMLLQILNCILGEGVGSRLQRQIREKKCYSANIASYIEWYQRFGALHIRFSVEKHNLYACIQEVVQVLQELKCHVTKEDLDVSLPFYTTNRAFYKDDTEQMNFQLGYYQTILNHSMETLTIPNDQCTYQQLQALAAEVFRVRNCCVVIVGNTKGVTKKSIRQLLQSSTD